MKIQNIVENEAGASACQAAHGLSFYIETKKHKILFDTSPSDLVLKNADFLGIDLTKIDTVILSHGHYDHSGGILSFVEINQNAKIYMQEKAGDDHYAFDGPDKGYRYIGIDKKILNLPQVIFIKGDCKIDEELQIFQIDKRDFPLPSSNKRLKLLSQGQYIQDDFQHEQNLYLTAENKKILLTGCSHNGILNIMQAFIRKFGKDKMPDLVLGGFHLMKKSEYSQEETKEIQEIAEKLKSYDTKFATCHCTGLYAFEKMKEIMGDKLTYIHSGDIVDLSF
ncbi:MAG: MBL fold metallo-hydrolase [Treponema sp.]|nr:MBL fold metallo-hydrolase [Treponema sp.]